MLTSLVLWKSDVTFSYNNIWKNELKHFKLKLRLKKGFLQHCKRGKQQQLCKTVCRAKISKKNILANDWTAFPRFCSTDPPPPPPFPTSSSSGNCSLNEGTSLNVLCHDRRHFFHFPKKSFRNVKTFNSANWFPNFNEFFTS